MRWSVVLSSRVTSKYFRILPLKPAKATDVKVCRNVSSNTLSGDGTGKWTDGPAAAYPL